MQPQNKSDYKQKITNFFGAVGYIACFLGWIWAIIQYISYILPLLEPSGKVPEVIAKNPENAPIPILGLVITGVMIAVSIIVIFKVTAKISTSGKKFVQATADRAAPFIIKSMHKRVTKKAKLQLSAKLKLILKIIIIAVPIVLSAFSIFLKKQTLDYSVIMAISAVLAILAMALFAIEYVLAKIFKIAANNLW